ncbi:hypothetical protein B566_EDAN010660 [Ephemera danica]|nr:hypothetical protein B566_EDAN010660 [Ephemera danica]
MIPSEQPIVETADGSRLNTTLGPLNEGDDVVLTCRVMGVKPLTVSISAKQNPLVADRRYEVTCESAGSRPPAVITWYKGKRQLRRVKEETRENSTVSELSFVPSTDDDGKYVTCRAENPNVTGAFLEDNWRIDVVYPPIVLLRLGSTLNADDIKEGDDVYFECRVQANPSWRKLTWLHNVSVC